MSVCSHKYKQAWSTLSVKLSSTFSVIYIELYGRDKGLDQDPSYMEKIIVLMIPYPFSSQTEYNTVVTVCVALPCTPPDCNEVSGDGVTRAHTPRSNTSIKTLRYNRRIEYIHGWEVFIIQRS